MISFLFQRILQALLVMFVVSTIAFSIQSDLGDPTRELAALSMSEAERQVLRDELGLNDPFIQRYQRFLVAALHGDLGDSIFFKKPALDVILSKLPATLELVFGATFIIICLSLPAGMYAAIYPRARLSRFVMSSSTLGISMPVFLTGILLIYVFSVQLNWLPSYGRGELVHIIGSWDTGFLSFDGLAHLLLPCITLSSIMLPLFIRLVRSEMGEALQSEYVRFANAKGLSSRKIWYGHALRNTLLPVVTVGGVQIGVMVAYTLLTESVFQWPGMGFLFLEAVNRSDIPLITAYIVVVGGIFVFVNTLVDILYGFIDPRIRAGAQ